ncbi:pentapeptide repeat-containing protein [Azospirillum sp.]|uniref:pentapeptide repeat-containing protein n=1 Tax=Azospirillum sp. TaxID=34012 RepID=UPI0026379B31|nr:pentapeptide repeat-containing protein [Azospirillum sp.]
MADIAKPSPPELKNLKPALPDVWDLAKLEASVNSTSQRAVTQWLAYLSLWAYLFFTTLSITDRALILLTPVKLPLIGVELGLQAFFWAGPPLFWVFHLYLVRKITVLARDVAFYRAAIQRFVPSEEAREPLYRRLDAFFLTRLLGHAEQGNLLRLFDGMIALATVAVMPLALMLAFQLRFLAFHDDYVTMWHRVCLVADVGLLVLLVRWLKAALGDRVRFLPEARGRWLRGGMEMARDMAGPVMAAYVAFSLLVATFPGEIHDGIVTFPGQDPDFLWRALAPRDVDFVDDEKLDKVQWTIDLRGRNLRGAQLSGADLRKARMTGVDLRGANVSFSQFQGADVSSSQFQGADVSFSQFKGVDVSFSQFQGADVSSSQFQGTDVQYSQFQGADVRYSQFQGANVLSSQFQGANMSFSQFQGADVGRANLWAAIVDSETSFLHADHREQIHYTRGKVVNDGSIDAWIAAAPAGDARDRMIKRMAILRTERKPDEDAKSERALRDALGVPPPTLRDDLTRYLDRLVCQEVGEAVHGVTSRTYAIEILRSMSSFDPVALAKRFLDPACLGEKHLKDNERTKLRRIIHNSETTSTP